MGPVSVKLENDLKRITQDAKIIMLLSFISIITPPLYLIALLFFLFYFNKQKKLKSDQSLSSEYSRLKAKTTKELRSIKWNNESLEKGLAGLLIAHRTTVIALIVIGIVIAIIITIIGLSYQVGWV